jgi:hypothetical protein
VAAAHDDRDPGGRGDAPQRGRVPADLVQREVDERPAARGPQLRQFLAGEVLVVQQAACPVLPDQVDEDVFVREHDAEFAGRCRPGDGHDLHVAIVRE